MTQNTNLYRVITLYRNPFKRFSHSGLMSWSKAKAQARTTAEKKGVREAEIVVSCGRYFGPKSGRALPSISYGRIHG